ncbi:MAG TPA: hypothetical protein VEP50_00650 [bacterium]|nr:hypothetical protein [bacterium]
MAELSASGSKASTTVAVVDASGSRSLWRLAKAVYQNWNPRLLSMSAGRSCSVPPRYQLTARYHMTIRNQRTVWRNEYPNAHGRCLAVLVARDESSGRVPNPLGCLVALTIQPLGANDLNSDSGCNGEQRGQDGGANQFSSVLLLETQCAVDSPSKRQRNSEP